MSIVIPLICCALFAGCWVGWQLLRQNGRILLRLEELEKRLNELEFGGSDEPAGLPVGSEAPAFELADLSGERKSLAKFRGQSVLLIFFNPDCGFCREMMPKLAVQFGVRRQLERDAVLAPDADAMRPIQSAVTAGAVQNDGEPVPGEGILPLILSTGDAEGNRKFFAEHKVGCPVLLQNDGEVAKAYQANGTPTGYLVNADGKIASELAIGAEALLKLTSGDPDPKSAIRNPQSEMGDRANRFSSRSLAASKLKRDGLKAGTPAPDFRLPRLDGRGELTLSDLRGRRVLLVFSSPHCGPCNTLAPELKKFHRQAGTNAASHSPRTCPPGEGEPTRALTVVMISKGEPKENRAKVKEHGLTFPVVLQQHWEISRLYAMFATPIAYLIDESGVTLNDVAVGVESILSLLVKNG